ncbi:MAG TPA: peptidoglycan DD-metalloendopeptidase family protein [Herpetosiphonaceae bacterium]
MTERMMRLVALVVIGLALWLPPATPIHAAGRPILTLPTPPGETWEVIQGYNCGTHDGWGRMSFDLVNHDGRTRGAPVLAAADGTLWWQGGSAGSLILDHGGGFYTMYSHMQTRIGAPVGTPIARGQQIGTVGAVNPTPTVPHLHFTLFRGEGAYAERRYPEPLSFQEGYDFPDRKQCSAYEGQLLSAEGGADAAATITWDGLAAQTWLSGGRADWSISDDQGVRGFSQAWDADPAGEAPQFEGAAKGFIELSEPGKHTFYVRIWDKAGNQTLETREFWYDPTAPSAPAATQKIAEIAASDEASLAWRQSSDELSGVKGYQIYIGSDPAGTSDWFVETPEVEAGKLSPGSYVLRARAQDGAGNFSDWVTLQAFEVK